MATTDLKLYYYCKIDEVRCSVGFHSRSFYYHTHEHTLLDYFSTWGIYVLFKYSFYLHTMRGSAYFPRGIVVVTASYPEIIDDRRVY